MMRSHAIPLFLGLAVASPAFGQEGTTAADSTAIMSVMANWERGWEAADADLASQDYTEDADWTNAFGTRLIGRDSVRAFLARAFQNPRFVAAQTQYQWHDLRFLGPETAVLRSFATRPETAVMQPEAPRRINHLRVFVKRNGTWKIISHLIADERKPGQPR